MPGPSTPPPTPPGTSSYRSDPPTAAQVGQSHHTASKMAQLLADTLLHAAPITGDADERARRRVRDEWLDSLEAHSTRIVGPLIDVLSGVPGTPPEVKAMLDEAAQPSAQFGSFVQQFLIFGLAFTVGQTALMPFVQAMQNDIWSSHPDRPYSIPEIATMVVRGISPGMAYSQPTPDWAVTEAAKTGADAEQIRTIVQATGMPPDMTTLFEMVRRGVITEDQLVAGIMESDTRDDWVNFVTKMRYFTVTPSDMVRAAVQGQLPYDVAEHWAHQVGLEPEGWIGDNPDWFKVLYDIGGRPPGPVEMGHAALRGFIPWDGLGPDMTTFAQAIHESDVKDKWEPVLKEMAQYYPPPGTVRTLLMHGGITKDQAIALWQADGVPPSIASAYAHLATVEQTTQERAVVKGDVEMGVRERILSDAQATAMLGQLGYQPESADLIIKLAKWRWNLETLRSSVTHIARLYTGHKMTATEASDSFGALGIEADQVTELMATLTVQRGAETVYPTPATITGAFHYGVIDQVSAMTALEQVGYGAYDAWLELSNREHAPLPNMPPPSTSAYQGLTGISPASAASTAGSPPPGAGGA